jgi:hypothetical protein
LRLRKQKLTAVNNGFYGLVNFVSPWLTRRGEPGRLSIAA